MTPEIGLLNFFPRAYSVRAMGGGKDEKGKAKSSYNTIRQPLPDAFLFGHFAGKQAISVQPILDAGGGNTCQWGMIDIDSYRDETLIKRVRKAVTLFQLTCYVEESKSGGAHVYFLLDQPTVVAPFQKALRKLSIWMGFPNAEIFPKQVSIPFEAGDLGSFVVLPGFGIGLDKAREQFSACTTTIKEFNKITDEGEFADGPACLSPLIKLGQANGFSNRNLTLYQLAVYFRYNSPAGWKERVQEYNSTVFDEPLPENEVNALIGQLEKNAKCHYRCSGEPFEAVCNKNNCQTRKFGVAARESASSIISPEGITVLLTDPPIYFATLINPMTGVEHRVKLTSDQLINVNQFKKRCLETIQALPSLPKQVDWESVVNNLMQSAQHLPVPFEMTEEARVLDAIYRYCLTSVKSTKPEDLLRGRVWLEDSGTGLIAHFRQVDFTNYLAGHRVAGLKSQEVHAVLNELCRMDHIQVEKIDLGGVTVSVYKSYIQSRYLELQAQIEKEKEAG